MAGSVVFTNRPSILSKQNRKVFPKSKGHQSDLKFFFPVWNFISSHAFLVTAFFFCTSWNSTIRASGQVPAKVPFFLFQTGRVKRLRPQLQIEKLRTCSINCLMREGNDINSEKCKDKDSQRQNQEMKYVVAWKRPWNHFFSTQIFCSFCEDFFIQRHFTATNLVGNKRIWDENNEECTKDNSVKCTMHKRKI